jgi:hypothetical protein
MLTGGTREQAERATIRQEAAGRGDGKNVVMYCTQIDQVVHCPLAILVAVQRLGILILQLQRPAESRHAQCNLVLHQRRYTTSVNVEFDWKQLRGAGKVHGMAGGCWISGSVSGVSAHIPAAQRVKTISIGWAKEVCVLTPL